MDKQSETQKTLGQAIDELISALSSIDESSRITAIHAACDHLKIRLFNSRLTQPAPAISTEPLPGEQGAPPRFLDIKSFRNEKLPSSANDMAAVVAFYLSELAPPGDCKAEVQNEDMVKYFKQAGFPLPKAPRMLLPNAKNSGYFDSGTSGGYKLNAVGYNLVAHSLPRTAAAGVSSPRRRKPRTTSRKHKASRT